MKMTDIEFVKGILITPDGEEHPFGIHSYVDEDKDENYHDSALKMIFYLKVGFNN